MSEPALDFSRYAPEKRPALAWDNPSPAAPDELAQTMRVLRACCALTVQCAWLALSIAWRRVLLRARQTIDRITHSLQLAWGFGGVGWGAFAGLAFIQFFAR